MQEGVNILKTRVTTNQKHTLDSQKPKRRKHKNNTKEIKPQKEKLKEKEQRRNTKSMEKKRDLSGNKYKSINNFLKCQWTKCSN